MDQNEDELRAEFYFAQIPVWILFHKDLQHSDIRVWCVLQRYAGDRWVCWPGHAAIAERACISKRQVQSCIERLCAVGALTVERRKKRVEKDGKFVLQNNTNVYTLKIAPPSLKSVSTLVVVADEGGSEGGAEGAGRGLAGPDGEPGGIATVATGMETVAIGGIATVSSEREPFTNSNSTFLLVATESPGAVGDGSAQRADTERKPARKKRKAEVVPLRDDVEMLCSTLKEYLLANGVRKTKANVTQGWRDEARRLLDVDKVPFDEAMRILHWCQKDSFWKGVILSMKKFRDKFDQLRMRANSGTTRHADAHAAADRLRAMAEVAERVDNSLQLEDGEDGTF